MATMRRHGEKETIAKPPATSVLAIVALFEGDSYMWFRIRHLHGQETRRHLRLLRQALHENAVESEALPWRMHP